MDEAIFVDGFHDIASVKRIKYNNLGKTGLRVSSVSIGCSPLGNCYGRVSEEEGAALVREGLRAGLNYLDTAPWYGNGRSEAQLGKALVGIPRQAYYIATKVGRYESVVERMFDFSAERTLASVDRSLELLGLDRVDVIQAHDIEFARDINQVINETLPALKKVVDDGKASFIGITSYSLELLKYVLEHSPVKIDTVLSYSRNTLMDRGLVEYLPYFEEAGVGVINGSVTSMGLLSSQGPQSWHPAGEDIQGAAAAARAMCETAGVEIAHLALQCSVATAGVSTNLLGCTTAPMLADSIRVAYSPPTQGQADLAAAIEKQCFSSLVRRDWGSRGQDLYFQQLAGKKATA